MKLPYLPVGQVSRETVDVFLGYDHNLRIGDGAFFDMENLTSDCYPVLSPRNARGVYARPASPQGLIGKDVLCYVDGAELVVGDRRIDLGLSTAAKDCPKQLVSMGAYVIILPDKKYLNTADAEDHGSIEASVTAEATFCLCAENGEEFPEVTVGLEPPEGTGCWLDTSGEKPVLKRYDTAQESWVGVESTFVRLAAPGIGGPFRVGDGVHVSGVAELEGTAVILARGEDFLVVPGLTEQPGKAAVTVQRRMPDMDFLIESENRLWGCRYGEGVNEIYASKLGDFRNWNCFQGLSTDSFAASCGSDGPFTGAVTHLGIRLFFKETCVHKVYGSYPATFSVRTTACRGVQRGCGRSLAIVNETLYYKSRSGICAYDGSLPVEVSQALGGVRYTGAVAGAIGSKYYISLEGQDGWHLFVYDTAKGLWHREDSLGAVAFCAFQGELYCIDGKSRNILTLLGSGEAAEETVTWMAQTGELALEDPDRKYLSRLSLRLQVEPGTEVELLARYDGGPEWVSLCVIHSIRTQSITVPVTPRRCDHLALQLRGRGGMKLYGITRTLQKGSDRR